MAYRVKITRRAQQDLEDIFDRIAATTSDAANAWYLGLRQAIRTLRAAPGRCPLTPENKDLRNLLYGHRPHVYRVVYRILEKQKQVEVLHIRHVARAGFAPEELNRNN
jgi:toxin ParE1/3/4